MPLVSTDFGAENKVHGGDEDSIWVLSAPLFDTGPMNHAIWVFFQKALGLYSLNGKTSYRQILGDLEASELGVIMTVSLWNLTGISTVLLSKCMSNFTAIRKV